MATAAQLLFLAVWILFLCQLTEGAIEDPPPKGYYTENGMVILPKDQQKKLLDEKKQKCYENILKDYTENRTYSAVTCAPYPSIVTTGYCPRFWDGGMCWSPSPPNQTAIQPCPNYINGFRTREVATRHCNADGTWFYNPEVNRTWTNYSLCFGDTTSINSIEIPEVSKILQEHVEKISTMYLIGYSISLVSLLLAVFIMLYFRKLHCPRNIVHINLFIALILRAIVSLLRELLLVDGVGFEKDIERDQNDNIVFKQGGTHWECKLLLSLFNYALSASYMWILMEGLYLHMLIFVSVFSEKSRVHWYMVAGWASPLLFIVPWIICRIQFDDTLCWNTWQTSSYVWIIKGPIAASIILNFIFFLNIIRVLFTKLRATNTREARKYRYRKLAKSTLVLIPLFGVPYIVFLGLPDMLNEKLEIAKLYFEIFFSSVQGLLVAILFCFLNEEVKNEIKKWWHRLRVRHGHFNRGGSQRNHSTWNTSVTFVARNGIRPSIQSNGSEDGRAFKGETTVITHNAPPQLSNGKIVKQETEKEHRREENTTLLNDLCIHNDLHTSNVKQSNVTGDMAVNDVTENGFGNEMNLMQVDIKSSENKHNSVEDIVNTSTEVKSKDDLLLQTLDQSQHESTEPPKYDKLLLDKGTHWDENEPLISTMVPSHVEH